MLPRMFFGIVPFTVSSLQKLKTDAKGWLWNRYFEVEQRSACSVPLVLCGAWSCKYICTHAEPPLVRSWLQCIVDDVIAWSIQHRRCEFYFLRDINPALPHRLPGLLYILFWQSGRGDPGLDKIAPSIVTLRWLWWWKSAGMKPSFYVRGRPNTNITIDQCRTVTKTASVN